MHPLTKFAAKLYPRWWRERYGEEFAALLEDARPGLRGALDILQGALKMQLSSSTSWKTVLGCAAAGMLVGIALTFALTPRYASNAVIALEGIPKTEMVNTINRYSQDVLSRSALVNVMRNLDLYPQERSKMPVEDILEIMRRDIRIGAVPVIENQREVPAFQLAFQYPDRVAAQKVVASLVTGFLDRNLQNSPPEGSPTMLLLDPASLPENPIFPLRKMFGVAGLGAGTFLGAVAALYFRRKRQPA